MKNILKLFLLLSLYVPMSTAQSPRAAAIGSRINASLGYSFTNLAVPSSNRIELNGLDAALNIDIIPHLGARVDLGYVRASDVLNSRNHSDVLSYLAGPVFYPVRRRKLAVFAQGLFGAARETGAVPLSGGGFLTGYANQFAWAAGTGAEYRVYESIGFRIGADYLHTRYSDPSLVIRGQSNLRLTGSFVYFFGKHSSKHHSSPSG
jgi:opacity protein-like surface antigen